MRATYSMAWWCGGVLLVAGGCAANLIPSLKSKAANDFGCSATELTNKGIDRYLDRVDGCGKENMYAYDHSAEQWVSPLDRATFELSCERGGLSSKVIGTNTVGIEGCGRKATYVLTIRGWVMNTHSD